MNRSTAEHTDSPPPASDADTRFMNDTLAAVNALEIESAEPSVSWEALIEQDAHTHGDDGSDHAEHVRSDSLAASVILLMVLSCIQPVVTFLRGIVFCRWLDPEQLGAWDMAFSFLTLAAPVIVFGIPGSFGRYVQHYLKQGQLSSFLRRTSLACLLASVVAIAALALLPDAFSRIIFGDASYAGLIPAMAVCLAAMIGFGFVIELLTALRLFRIVSLLQFVKGVGFLLFGGGLLWLWQIGPRSIIVAYAIACGITVIAGGWRVGRELRRLPSEATPPTQRSLWAKLMPFAVWIWVTNVLDNLYMVVDRYMMIHYSGLPNIEALNQVGNYHSSRIVPMLFVSFAGMLASLILPHLSHDWEAGHRRRVADQVVLSVKLVALALAAGSLAVLIAGPWLFEFGFQGKYDSGLSVLPWVLTFCAWFGVTYVAEMYIFCTERVKIVSLAMTAGLLVNIGLNLLLLPSLQLLGAVLATALSRLIVLAVLYVYSIKHGMPFKLSMWLLTLVPAVVVLGPVVGGLILGAVLLGIACTNHVITRREKAVLARAAREARERVRGKLGWT